MRRILHEMRRLLAERRIISALRNTAVNLQEQKYPEQRELKIRRGSRIRALAIILSESGSDRPMPRRKENRKRR